MSVLSVFLKTEKVIVTFVILSFARMSSETQEAINGHCARANLSTLAWIDQFFSQEMTFLSDSRFHRCRLEVLSNDRLPMASLYSQFQIVYNVSLPVCLSVFVCLLPIIQH
jgi:uncharacterized protein YsxB (DUF464 family)